MVVEEVPGRVKMVIQEVTVLHGEALTEVALTGVALTGVASEVAVVLVVMEITVTEVQAMIVDMGEPEEVQIETLALEDGRIVAVVQNLERHPQVSSITVKTLGVYHHYLHGFCLLFILSNATIPLLPNTYSSELFALYSLLTLFYNLLPPVLVNKSHRAQNF